MLPYRLHCASPIAYSPIMTKNNPTCRSPCPISYSLELFGDKWTLLVIRDMVFQRKQYFRDFLASPEKIASNILAARLKSLVSSGIISRRPDPANARKIIYELTEKGEDLIPALLELAHWGAKYDADTGAPKPPLTKGRRRVKNSAWPATNTCPSTRRRSLDTAPAEPTRDNRVPRWRGRSIRTCSNARTDRTTWGRRMSLRGGSRSMKRA